jgi:hypothetical protein
MWPNGGGVAMGNWLLAQPDDQQPGDQPHRAAVHDDMNRRCGPPWRPERRAWRHRIRPPAPQNSQKPRACHVAPGPVQFQRKGYADERNSPNRPRPRAAPLGQARRSAPVPTASRPDARQRLARGDPTTSGDLLDQLQTHRSRPTSDPAARGARTGARQRRYFSRRIPSAELKPGRRHRR